MKIFRIYSTPDTTLRYLIHLLAREVNFFFYFNSSVKTADDIEPSPMEAVSGGSASPSGESKPAPGEKDEIIEPEQDLSQASVQSASALELEQKAEIPSFSDLSIDTQGKSAKKLQFKC